MLILKRILFYFISFTGGIIMSLIGGIIILCLAPFKRVHVFHGRLYGVIGSNGGGLELGCFFLVDKISATFNATKTHEAGHTLQHCLGGPLFIFVIAIPSAIRYWYREISKKAQPPYDAIGFEGQATRWGEKYILTDRW